jgi:hypothetical protein
VGRCSAGDEQEANTASSRTRASSKPRPGRDGFELE